ncbi:MULTISPECIES: TetR/AcrR family transcriptional regulator [unclassified Blastococcus]
MTAVREDDELMTRGRWRSVPALEMSPILSAALDAFNEHGYHGTSVRDIAGRVGVTVPALYYHHENKEAILFALLDAGILRLTRMCEAALADAGDNPADRFLNLVEAIVLYMAHSTKIAGVDAELRSLGPENRSAYSEKRRRIEEMLVDTLQAGEAAGLFDVTSPKDTARALLGMFQAIATWYRPGGPLSAQDLAHNYVDIAAHTVGAPAVLIRRVREQATVRRGGAA